MSISYLTTSSDAMVASLISGLGGQGYSFGASTQSFTGFLFGAVNGLAGSSLSDLTTGQEGLLAALATQLAGSSYSALTSTRSQLLEAIVNAL